MAQATEVVISPASNKDLYNLPAKIPRNAIVLQPIRLLFGLRGCESFPTHHYLCSA